LEGLAGKVTLSIGARGDCGKCGCNQQKTMHEESLVGESSSLNLPDSPSKRICWVREIHKPLILPAGQDLRPVIKLDPGRLDSLTQANNQAGAQRIG
jgi:hypothetical protein